MERNKNSMPKWLRDASMIRALRDALRPRSLRIGMRLTLCFVGIVCLMLTSYLVTLWQLRSVRQQEQHMQLLDQESHAVLAVHATLLALHNGLQNLADSEDRERFATEAGELRNRFLGAVGRARQAVQAGSGTDRDATTINMLETVQSSLSTQIDALAAPAGAADWAAVRFRIRDQVAPLSALTAQLVEKVNEAVIEEKSVAQRNIQNLGTQVFALSLAAALFSLMVAGLLGTIVTRSITQPLAQLDAGSHALAMGDFHFRVSVDGNDELASLARVFNDATQRLSALYGALKTSEERFRTVVKAAPVGIAVLDANSTIQLFNARFLEITELTAEQAERIRLDDHRIQAFREDGTPCPTPERLSQLAIRSGKPVLNRVMRRRPHPITGEQRWILASAWPLLRADGSVEQVITTLTDITDQKNAEAELRAGRELLAQAQRAGRLGCFDLNLKTNTVAWSPELADLFGLSPGASTGRHQDWEELVHPDDRVRASASVAEALKTGESIAEYRIRRRSDGEVRWVESRGKLICDDTGQPLRLIGVTMDITNRRKVEEALRRRDEEFHIIFEYSALGMVLLDPAGHLLRTNPAFRNLLDCGEAELKVLTFEQLTHPEDVDLNRSLFQDLVAGKIDRYQLKKRYLRKNGETRSARVTVSALRKKTRELRYCVAMVEDVTAQEVAQHTLLQMSSRLIHIQEEEQRRIAREVHDSTSQEITALTLNLGALKASEQSLPENARRQVRESLALAKTVAREIRTFSYLLHPPMLKELGLWAALRMFVQEFRERSGLVVSFEIDDELQMQKLKNDQEMAIFRYVQEAMANVHRHSGSKTASVTLRLKDRIIEASIQDNGRGITPDLLRDIRESKGRSGGVGLSGMHERIAYIGGRVEISSDPHGTTVSAFIPIDFPEISTEENVQLSFAASPTRTQE